MATWSLVLPRLEEFKYLLQPRRYLWFTTEGKQANQSGVCSDAAPVPICRGKEGLELIGDALDLLVDLRFGHELLVMTKKTRFPMQAAEMGFLRRVAGFGHLQDRLRSWVSI